MSARQNVQSHRLFLWWGILILTTLWFIYTFFGVTATSFEYTYLKPAASPGTLYTERWSRDFFFTGSLLLFFLIPLTAAFMSDSPCKTWRRILHIFTVVVLWLYFVVILVLWAYDYAHANNGDATNQYNRANDDRWCCYYRNVAGVSCPNTADCPGVSPAMFVVNPLFLWRFWWLLVFVLLMMAHFGYILWGFQPAVQAYVCELNGETAATAVSAPISGRVKYRPRKQ
jgi:hypothetical protein